MEKFLELYRDGSEKNIGELVEFSIEYISLKTEDEIVLLISVLIFSLYRNELNIEKLTIISILSLLLKKGCLEGALKRIDEKNIKDYQYIINKVAADIFCARNISNKKGINKMWLECMQSHGSHNAGDYLKDF